MKLETDLSIAIGTQFTSVIVRRQKYQRVRKFATQPVLYATDVSYFPRSVLVPFGSKDASASASTTARVPASPPRPSPDIYP